MMPFSQTMPPPPQAAASYTMPPPSFVPQQQQQQQQQRQQNEEELQLQQAIELSKREEEEKQRRLAAASSSTTTTVANTGNEDLARKALYSTLVETANPTKLKRDPVTTLPPPTPATTADSTTMQSPTHSPVVQFSSQQQQQQQPRSMSPLQQTQTMVPISQPYMPTNVAPPTPLVMPNAMPNVSQNSNVGQNAMQQQQQQELQLPQYQPQQQTTMTQPSSAPFVMPSPMVGAENNMQYGFGSSGMTPYMNAGLQQQSFPQSSSLPFTSPLQMPAVTANLTNPALATALVSAPVVASSAVDPIPSMLPKPEEEVKKPLTPEEEAGRKAWLMEEFKIFAKMGIIPPVVPEFTMPLDMLEKLHDFCEDLFEDKVGVDMMGAGYVQLIKLIEFTNERFHPVSRFTGGSDLKLEGAGRKVEEKIDKFKLPFTKIYRKYLKDKIGGEASPFMQIGIQTLKILGKVHNENLNKEMHNEARRQYGGGGERDEDDYDDNEEPRHQQQQRRQVPNEATARPPPRRSAPQRRSLDEQQLTSYREPTAVTGLAAKSVLGPVMPHQTSTQPPQQRPAPTPAPSSSSSAGMSFGPNMLFGFGDDGFDETNAMAPSSPTMKKTLAAPPQHQQQQQKPSAPPKPNATMATSAAAVAASSQPPRATAGIPTSPMMTSPMMSGQYKPQGSTTATSSKPTTVSTSSSAPASSKPAVICDSDICVLLPKSPTAN